MPLLTANEVLTHIDGVMVGTSDPNDGITIQNDPNKGNSHSERFQKRSQAFFEGAKLLIDNIPLNELKANSSQASDKRRRIKSAMEHLYNAYQRDLGGIKSSEEGKHVFDEFLCKLTLLLESQTAMKAKNIAKHLSVAERVYGWEKGRKPLVTMSNGINPRNNSEQIIVQVEIPRCNLTLAQKEEYMRAINAHEKNKPKWFKTMPLWERRYLLKHLEGATLENIDEKILSIPAALRHLPGLPNYSEHILRIYKKNAIDGTYKLLSESRRERSGIVCPIDLHKRKYRAERQRLTDENVEQLLATTLKDRALRYIENWGTNAGDPVEIPITLQTLLSPGLVQSLISKFKSDNNAMMIENKEEAIRKLRIALDNPSANKNFLEQLGLEVDIEKNAIKFENNETKEIIYIKPTIISTNHSVNAWRKHPILLDSSVRASSKRNSDELLRIADQFIIKSPIIGSNRLTEDRQTLLNAIRDYKETPSMATTKRHRAFFLSSLEQIISDKCGGIGYGSCKSGKDRKGIETLHTDAMLIYRSRYKILPRYNDTKENRKRFVAIFVELYKTRHAHEVASQNAFGSRGLKELNGILPKDIKKAIKAAISQDELDETNKYGSLNKVENELLKNKDEKKRLLDEMKNDDDLQKMLASPKLDQSSLWARAPGTMPPTKVEVRNDFDNILKQLKDTAEQLSTTLKVKSASEIGRLNKLMTRRGKHLEDPLSRLIGIFELSKSNKSLTTEPLISRAIDVMNTLRYQVEARYHDPKGLILDEFNTICDKAITNLKDREGMESFHAKSRPEPYDGTDVGYETALKTVVELQPTASSPHFVLGSKQTSPPTDYIGKKELLISEVTNVRGSAVIVGRIDQNGQAINELRKVPPELLPENIWKKAYTNLISTARDGKYNDLDAKDFDKIYTSVFEIAKINGREITNKDIRNYLKNSDLPDINKTADAIFDAYNKIYQETMYREKYKGETFPSDDLIKIAIQQVEARLQLDPTQTMVIKNDYSLAYAEAVILYCKSQNYKFSCGPDCAAVDKKATDRRADVFLNLLEKHSETFGYMNKRALTKKVEKVLPEISSPGVKVH